MSLADSLGNAKVLDTWREQIGLRYPFEAEDSDLPTVSGLPLQVRADAAMPYGKIDGLDLPVSRLVMGCDNQPTLAHASAMFDHFFAAGGNAFDTGYIYGGGLQERLLGRWIANRGVRDQVAILVKGAHTPHCDPESITSQLTESLDRLGTDYADLYLMHRDNPDDRCRGVRRRARRRGPERPDQGLRRLQLDAGPDRCGQRVRRADRQARVLACSATTSAWPRRTTSRGPGAST